jgi:hypothetical protein
VSRRVAVVVVVIVVMSDRCVVVVVALCRMVVVRRCVVSLSLILVSCHPSSCAFVTIAPPPRVAEGKGRVTIAIPSVHSEGEGNTVTVTHVSPLVDVVARPEGTIDMPRSHCDVALS